MIIGSHVSMSAPSYLAGSVQEMLSYQANAMMIYTGAPQNSKRVALEKLKITEATSLLEKHQISMDHVIIHAPYLINLANTQKQETFDLGVELLKNEIQRTLAIGAKYVVLHPGSHVGAGIDKGIESIIHGLNLVLEEENEMIICLETMAGKGTECGFRLEQLQKIIQGCAFPQRLGICMDTCHMHDAGYDLNQIDDLLNQFDQILGLDLLKVIHLNDSVNECGARKDRHANIGFGKIGFETLCKIAHHPLLAHIPKILETPYVQGQTPYGAEIEMILSQRFDEGVLNNLVV